MQYSLDSFNLAKKIVDDLTFSIETIDDIATNSELRAELETCIHETLEKYEISTDGRQ